MQPRFGDAAEEVVVLLMDEAFQADRRMCDAQTDKRRRLRVAAGWRQQVRGWTGRWWMEEPGARTFGSGWAAGIDRAMLYGMRCIANPAKRRAHGGVRWDEISANNEAGWCLSSFATTPRSFLNERVSVQREPKGHGNAWNPTSLQIVSAPPIKVCGWWVCGRKQAHVHNNKERRSVRLQLLFTLSI